MAQQEMEQIKELDHDFYQTHVDKFIMYYSRVDEWAPLDHYEFMTEKFPNGKNNEKIKKNHMIEIIII